jgi:transcriptional pleiotropic repressor
MNRKTPSGKADNVKWTSESDTVTCANEEFLEGLLEKTRQVGRVLQNRKEDDVLDYIALSKWLSEFLSADVCIASREGKVLGRSVSC